MPLMILIGFAISLFLLSYITKRRFGVLGLALCAGALLSQYFAGSATGFIEANGVMLIAPPLSTVVAISLVFVPAFLLLFSGPKYSSKKAAFVSSIGFGLFGTVLALPALLHVVIFDPQGKAIFEFIQLYSTMFVTAGIAVAILDMMLIHGPKHGRKSKEH